MPLEIVPLAEVGSGAKAAPYLANCPAYPVGLRRHEQRHVSYSEVLWDLEVSLYCAVSAARHFLYTPFYPN